MLFQLGQTASCSFSSRGEIHSWEWTQASDAFLQGGPLWHSNPWSRGGRSKQWLCGHKPQSCTPGGRLTGVGDAWTRARQRFWSHQASWWGAAWGQAWDTYACRDWEPVLWAAGWPVHSSAKQSCFVTNVHARHVVAGPQETAGDVGTNALSHYGKIPGGPGRVD